MKSLKVAILFDDSLDRPDGVQQYIRVVGQWLSKRGHKVSYLVGESEKQDYFDIYSLSRNVNISGNQNKLSLPLPAKISRINDALNNDFDVVHVQMPYNPLLSGRLIKRLSEKTALVGTFHIVSERKFEKFGSKVLSFLQSKSLSRVNQVMSVSSAAQAFSTKYFGIDSVIVPNAVDLSRFRDAQVKDYLRPAKFNITYLGRLVERKGVEHLLNSLVIMKAQGELEDTLVHICGDGPLKHQLESKILENKLDKNVILHGFIQENEKADYLASADVCVFPSTGGESFGIVLVEAMASGNSVVLAGNNAGYSTVMDNKQELLFNPKEPHQLAKMLTELKNNKKLFSTLNEWQNKRVSIYDIEVVGPQIVQIYHSAINKQLAR